MHLISIYNTLAVSLSTFPLLRLNLPPQPIQHLLPGPHMPLQPLHHLLHPLNLLLDPPQTLPLLHPPLPLLQLPDLLPLILQQHLQLPLHQRRLTIPPPPPLLAFAPASTFSIFSSNSLNCRFNRTSSQSPSVFTPLKSVPLVGPCPAPPPTPSRLRYASPNFAFRPVLVSSSYRLCCGGAPLFTPLLSTL